MLIRSMLIAISTYSVIPVPQFEWKKENMQYSICFFPVVGIFVGALTALWLWVAPLLGVGHVIYAAILTVIPLLITGGIHMDGYMDTVDALASHQTRERKLEIMKDPNTGAFAVIYCLIFLISMFGLLTECAYVHGLRVLVPSYVFSRSLSAFCAVTLKNARRNGMLCSFTQDISRKRSVTAIVIVALFAGAAMIFADHRTGTIAIACALLAMLLYRRMAKRIFGGCTGDTAGFFLQIAELAIIIGIWIGELI